MGIKIPYSQDEINQAKEELIKKMNFKDCYVRPFAWRGSNLMGLSTTHSNIHVSIAVWDDWTTYYKLEDMKEAKFSYISMEKTLHQIQFHLRLRLQGHTLFAHFLNLLLKKMDTMRP